MSGSAAKRLAATLNAERRVHRLLQKHKLLFVKVGAYAHQDRVISTHDERPDGATVINDEYDGILRAIVAAARDGK